MIRALIIFVLSMTVLTLLTPGGIPSWATPTTSPTKKGVEIPTSARWAVVVRVIDGDTLLVNESLDEEHTRNVKIRLRDINCPEIKTAKGVEAQAFTEGRIKPGDKVVLNDIKPDNYYRLDAVVWYPGKDGWVNLNQELLDSGNAVPMKDGKKP